MKRCPICKKEKYLDDFNLNPSKNDGRQQYCILCERDYRKVHYHNNKEKYIARIKKNKARIVEFFVRYKKKCKCSNCDETRWYVLDFHHRDKDDKEYNIANMSRSGTSIKRLKNEIRKCIVLCSNCHRELHYLENVK